MSNKKFMLELYCFALKPRRIQNFGEYKQIPLKDIVAVTRYTEDDPSGTPEQLYNFARNVDEIGEKFNAVLPVRYGTIADSEKEIKELMNKNYHQIKDRLDLVKGKVEYQFRAYWKKMPGIIEQSISADPILQHAREHGLVYKMDLQQRSSIGQILFEVIEQKRKELSFEFFKQFSPYVFLQEPEAVTDERMISAKNILVSKSKEQLFLKKIQELENKMKKEKIHFTYKKMNLPFHFANIHLTI